MRKQHGYSEAVVGGGVRFFGGADDPGEKEKSQNIDVPGVFCHLPALLGGFADGGAA